ncbi:cytochrome c oxidase accessory protein CcoG [Thalassotalea atypica]|uniref:cytochrome c oxidase accessory protein CcoG n=1 Tax=Thalassotalea atypica TaxID=2054316 RepID=UPI0025723851|nr:cytochrome c oxidase accessory protein CcoG [Thalassotalea atypica]
MKFDIKEEDLIIKPYKSEDSIYVRQQKGKFQSLRKYTGTLLMIVFVLIPWLTYQGEQAILLNIADQQFRFFSMTFFPQDLTILAALFMVGAFTLFFITTWLGRVWCGFLCPQTVWMFMYVWVEEKIEGTRNQRIKLDQAPLSWHKTQKKLLKHSAWLAISFFTATSFMAYFIPAKELYTGLIEFDWSAIVLSWIAFFTLCTYGNAGWLREKMCIYMCPYSRFQSAMFDKNTLLIAYDTIRGESRGRRKRNEDPKQRALGDCVDCNLCVQVCPAGIDIRNGLQYECISCGACIDACDQTMSQFNYPKGLISFTSENALAGTKVKTLRPKILSYGVITLIMFILMGYFVSSRALVEASILRDRNVLYRANFDGSIENSYQLKLTNKMQTTESFILHIADHEHVKFSIDGAITAQKLEMKIIPFTLTIAPDYITERVSSFELVISNPHDEVLATKPIRFYSN